MSDLLIIAKDRGVLVMPGWRRAPSTCYGPLTVWDLQSGQKMRAIRCDDNELRHARAVGSANSSDDPGVARAYVSAITQRVFSFFVSGVALCCFALPANTLAQDADYYERLGNSAMDNGKWDRAIEYYSEMIRVEEDWELGYCLRGIAWRAKGVFGRAMADFNKALLLNPRYAGACLHRGSAWRLQGFYDLAIDDCNRAIRLSPRCAAAYCHRGHAWWDKGEYDKAIADYKEAVRLKPSYSEPCNALAWVQATCPRARYRDGEQALKNAIQACEMDPGRHEIHDTIAAAYAEGDKFDLACAWQEKAIELARSEKTKREYRSRLELYQRERPYRQLPSSR